MGTLFFFSAWSLIQILRAVYQGRELIRCADSDTTSLRSFAATTASFLISDGAVLYSFSDPIRDSVNEGFGLPMSMEAWDVPVIFAGSSVLLTFLALIALVIHACVASSSAAERSKKASSSPASSVAADPLALFGPLLRPSIRNPKALVDAQVSNRESYEIAVREDRTDLAEVLVDLLAEARELDARETTLATADFNGRYDLLDPETERGQQWTALLADCVAVHEKAYLIRDALAGLAEAKRSAADAVGHVLPQGASASSGFLAALDDLPTETKAFADLKADAVSAA